MLNFINKHIRGMILTTIIIFPLCFIIRGNILYKRNTLNYKRDYEKYEKLKEEYPFTMMNSRLCNSSNEKRPDDFLGNGLIVPIIASINKNENYRRYNIFSLNFDSYGLYDNSEYFNISNVDDIKLSDIKSTEYLEYYMIDKALKEKNIQIESDSIEKITNDDSKKVKSYTALTSNRQLIEINYDDKSKDDKKIIINTKNNDNVIEFNVN